MTAKEILTSTNHRPWKLPTGNWRFYQEWKNAVFLHWPVELDELRKFVPDELEIDLFENRPWVSLVAFTMEGVRLKNWPSVKPVSNFDEINIRTYVRSNGKSGVYFLSIEGGKLLSCKLAVGISKLPYRFSKMKRTDNFYSASNTSFDDTFEIKYEIGNPVEKKSAQDKWLTERYALFQETVSAINCFEIHHVEWPIQKINVSDLKLNYSRFNKLVNNNPMIGHYSTGVQVLAWNKSSSKRITKEEERIRI